MKERKTFVAVVAGLAAIVIGAVPVAKADDADDRYIWLLNKEGIGQRIPRERAIHLGHTICSDLSHGKTPLEEAKGKSGADLSMHDLAALIAGAVGAYCPEYSGEIERGE